MRGEAAVHEKERWTSTAQVLIVIGLVNRFALAVSEERESDVVGAFLSRYVSSER